MFNLRILCPIVFALYTWMVFCRRFGSNKTSKPVVDYESAKRERALKQIFA